MAISISYDKENMKRMFDELIQRHSDHTIDVLAVQATVVKLQEAMQENIAQVVGIPKSKFNYSPSVKAVHDSIVIDIDLSDWRGPPKPKRNPSLRQLNFVWESMLCADHRLLGSCVVHSQRTKPFSKDGFYYVPSRWIMSILRSQYRDPLLSDLEICAVAVFPKTLPKE